MIAFVLAYLVVLVIWRVEAPTQWWWALYGIAWVTLCFGVFLRKHGRMSPPRLRMHTRPPVVPRHR